MKRRLYILCICIIVLIIGYVAYDMRIQVAAKFWHWRYGYITFVADYTVPVPEHWLVEHEGTDNNISLIDVRLRRTADPFSDRNIILVSFTSHFPGNLDFVRTHDRDSLKRDGLETVEEKELQTLDEAVVCAGGNVLHETLHVPSTSVVSMQCISRGGLNLTFSGNRSGLPEFYTIISQIRKGK